MCTERRKSRRTRENGPHESAIKPASLSLIREREASQDSIDASYKTLHGNCGFLMARGRRGRLSQTGVDLKQTIAVKIGGAWAVAGALWVRFYAGLREGRELRLEYQPFGRRFRGESDGDLDVTNKARIYLPRASL